MKKTLILLAIALVLLSACAKGKGADAYADGAIIENGIDDEPIALEDSDGEETPVGSNSEARHVLDGVNVYDLFQMNLGEAIDLLGPNHSDPFLYIYGRCIKYEGSCMIRYGWELKLNENNEPELDMEEEISAVTIYQEYDVCKGIGVGKTLDEIDSNPDLQNKLDVMVNEMDGSLYAVGFYDYNNCLMGIVITFNEDMVCIEISINVAEDNRGELWIADSLL